MKYELEIPQYWYGWEYHPDDPKHFALIINDNIEYLIKETFNGTIPYVIDQRDPPRFVFDDAENALLFKLKFLDAD